MGNTPTGETKGSSRKFGADDQSPLEIRPYRRDLSPTPQNSQPSEVAKEFHRSKSVKAMNSLNRSGILDTSMSCKGKPVSPYKNVIDDLMKIHQFSINFMQSNHELKMNANFGPICFFSDPKNPTLQQNRSSKYALC